MAYLGGLTVLTDEHHAVDRELIQVLLSSFQRFQLGQRERLIDVARQVGQLSLCVDLERVQIAPELLNGVLPLDRHNPFITAAIDAAVEDPPSLDGAGSHPDHRRRAATVDERGHAGPLPLCPRILVLGEVEGALDEHQPLPVVVGTGRH